MIVREKKVQELKVGEIIVFKRGGDVAQKTGTVSDVQITGKYVTIWFTGSDNATGYILCEKDETILITKARFLTTKN